MVRADRGSIPTTQTPGDLTLEDATAQRTGSSGRGSSQVLDHGLQARKCARCFTRDIFRQGSWSSSPRFSQQILGTLGLSPVLRKWQARPQTFSSLAPVLAHTLYCFPTEKSQDLDFYSPQTTAPDPSRWLLGCR